MEEEHLHNLDEVLKRLQQHGITVKWPKLFSCRVQWYTSDTGWTERAYTQLTIK